MKADIEETDGNSDFVILFADGSAASLGYLGHDWHYCIKTKDLSQYEDKNGTGCFTFGFYPNYSWDNPNSYAAQNFKNKKFEPFVIDKIRDENNDMIADENGNFIFLTEKDLIEQKCYAKIIQLNGWKIPKNYPLNF